MASNLLQFFFGGLSMGAVYAIVALGFIFIYSVSGVINLAQGEYVMIGGFATLFFFDKLHLPMPVAAILAVVVAGLVAYLQERLVMRPLGEAPLFSFVLITLGVSIVLTAVGGIVFGVEARYLDGLFPPGVLKLGGAGITYTSLGMIAVLTLLSLLSTFFLQRSYIGAIFRATCDDPWALRLSGIDPRPVTAAAYAISGMLGAVAGILAAPMTGLDYTMGLPMAIKGFIAATMAGLGNPLGGLVMGFVLGLLESFMAGVISSTYKDVLTLLLLFVVLIVRPSGLFRGLQGRRSSV